MHKTFSLLSIYLEWKIVQIASFTDIIISSLGYRAILTMYYENHVNRNMIAFTSFIILTLTLYQLYGGNIRM